MDDQDNDPFRDLGDWAKSAERRAKRAHRWSRLRLRKPTVRRRRRSEGSRTVLWVASAVVAAFLLAAGIPYAKALFAPASSDDGTDPVAYATGAVPSGVSVTTSASAAPTDPFEDTPAATYPKGEAGITLPAATAVTGFTLTQVNADLQQVRQALVAGRLDQKMLVGHDTSTFLALLAPNTRTDTTKWLAGNRRMDIATWIDPSVKLNPDEQPRVSGRVTFDSAKVDGLQTLQITTNFIWVYAFSARQQQPIAAIHDEIRWEFPRADQARKGDRGMWVAHSHTYVAWMDCAAVYQGLLAPFKPDYTGPQPTHTEAPGALLRPDHTLDIPDDCASGSASPKP